MLLRSGVQYARTSVEFRLMRMFSESRDVYRMSMDTWIGNRLLEVASLIYAKFGGQDVKSFDRDARKERAPILDLIDPYVAERDAERAYQDEIRKKSTEQKKVFMETLGNKPFSSIEDIIEAVTGERGTLVEVEKHRNTV